MSSTSSKAIASRNAKERLIVALDVSSGAEAMSIVEELRGAVGAFKVGMQLFTAEGPDLVRRIVATGEKVFLDLKFHDIPNTVANAAAEAARLGVWMLNVHASGGSEMMLRTRELVTEVCDKEGIDRPLLIGVTVLTSSDQEHLAELGVSEPLETVVTRLARLAAHAGFDGVVASPLEAAAIRRSMPEKEFVIVTPGIRPAATNDDQKRVNTFAAAIGGGSTFAVVGRPITLSPDRLAAVAAILEDGRS